MKRLIKKAIELDQMGIPPMVQQKGPAGYDSFEDFINKATDEEIKNYQGDMDAETLKQMEIDKFDDSQGW